MSTPSTSSPFDITARRVAYFSMEIALAKALPTYSGGLGMLAGDTLRAAADLGTSLVAVSLCHRKGYFQQHLDAAGQQTESPVPWSPESLPSAGRTITLSLQGRPLTLQAWRFDVVGVTGHVIPVFLLDADVEGNDPWDRRLTDHLYGGDTYYRLCQEAILGLGGIHLLHALGCQPEVCHMNEGHASLLSIGLLEARLAPQPLAAATLQDAEVIRQQCVFTTHTPVPAGHDQFGLDQMQQVLGAERSGVIERFGCLHNGLLNMTYLALRFSRYVNGVAMQHGKVSQAMFPQVPVHAITNGVHAATWLSPAFQQLFDREIPDWRRDNNYLRSVYGIAPEAVTEAHAAGKHRLLATIAERTGTQLDPAVLTLGFARRVATYKRITLLFHNPERLLQIAQRLGGLQIVFAGKAHPADNAGKALIREIFSDAEKLSAPQNSHLDRSLVASSRDAAERPAVPGSGLKILYLENYDWELGEQLTNGVDVWLNTPLRPYEASGTSGMKAAINGVPSLSVLDGWWIEGCAEDTTGWAIPDCDDEAAEAEALYTKLEQSVAPMYRNPAAWAAMQRHCIAMNGSFFNTHRMLQQYIANAYFPLPIVPVSSADAAQAELLAEPALA